MRLNQPRAPPLVREKRKLDVHKPTLKVVATPSYGFTHNNITSLTSEHTEGAYLWHT